MTYQIKRTSRNSLGGPFWKAFSALTLIAVLIFSFSFFDSLRSFIPDLLSPLMGAGNRFYREVAHVPAFFMSNAGLIDENSRLLSEMEKMRLEMADYESLSNENFELRKRLDLRPSEKFEGVSVVARPPQIPLDSLFLDKGGGFGINDGDLVLAGDRILIGKIAEVSGGKSIATLSSFAGETTYGFVERTGEPIEITGTGGGGMEAKVPIDFDIEVGDKIIVSNSARFLAAVVGMVEEDHSSGFKNILMSLPVNVSKIDIVFIKPNAND